VKWNLHFTCDAVHRLNGGGPFSACGSERKYTEAEQKRPKIESFPRESGKIYGVGYSDLSRERNST